MDRLPYYMFFISALLACNSEREIKIVQGDLKDFKVEDITLVLDEFSTGNSQLFQYSQIGDNEYLFMVETGGIGSTKGPNIDLYDLNNGEKLKRLHVPLEGPNGVPLPPKVWMLNLDSLLLITKRKRYIMNWEGEIINEIELENFIESAEDKYPQISNYAHPIFLKDEIIIGLMPGLWESELWLPDKRFIKLSTKENKVSGLINYSYPEIYKEYDRDINYIRMFSQQVGEDVFVSFALGDSIYKLDGQKLKPAFSLRSLNDHKFLYVPIDESKGGLITITAGSSAAYLGMLYDPYRKVFYRIMSQENTTPGNDMSKRKYSVLVADLEGNFLAELEFSRNEYLFHSGFIHPKGLALAAIKENDDELRFDFFDFSQAFDK